MLFPRNALAHATLLSPRDSSSSTPSPLNVAPSQYWDGNDGIWSSFAFQVGSPLQVLRGYASTAASASWVSYAADACPQYLPLPLFTGGDCATSRGGLFNPNTSKTWIDASETVAGSAFFNLGVDSNLALDSVSAFGLDTLQLGFNDGSPLQNQTIALSGDPRYWIGGLALSPRPTNFSNMADPQPSILTTLANHSVIPSLSYGYTAGAYYRYNRVYGSLIFGGYDATLWTPQNWSIPMGLDSMRELIVSVRSISSNATSAKLLPGGSIYAAIDSSFPFMWLPLDACRAFEQAFGLQWDTNSSLYLMNTTAHNALRRQNPNITLEVGASMDEAHHTNTITLPYSAFDLNVSFPWIPQGQQSTYYFPLKRAANETQYTLGRTILQEAYLAVNYESRNFSLTQRQWARDQSTNTNVKAIYPGGTHQPDEESSGISGGAIAGIVVGVVGGLLMVAGLATWYFFRQRRFRRVREAALAAEEKNGDGNDASSGADSGYLKGDPKVAPDGTNSEIQELGNSRQIHEAPNAADGEGGKAPHGELQGSGAGAWEADSSMRFELAGSDVPLGMSEKLGGAKLVGWDGRVATEGDGSLQRILSNRERQDTSPLPRSTGSASPR